MDMVELSQDYMLVALPVAVAVVLGCLTLLLRARRNTGGVAEDPRNKRIRELEAELKVLRRTVTDKTDELETRARDCEASQETIHDLNALLAERDDELKGLRKEVRSAVAKTRELRRELSERAAETIREHVRAKEALTELDVMRAGSDAMVGEFARLQAADRDAGAAAPFAGDDPQPDLLADVDLFGDLDREDS